MVKKTYTVLVIGILCYAEHAKHKISDAIQKIKYRIQKLWWMLLDKIRQIYIYIRQTAIPSIKNILAFLAKSIKAVSKTIYPNTKNKLIALKVEYQKLDKVGILMKAQKIIVIISIMLFAGAIGLLSHRGMNLINQLRSEIKIENIHTETQPVILINSEIPINSVIDPTITAKVKFSAIPPKFINLLKANEDTVGWLKIDNTKIDHVVIQGDDNIFYKEHDYFGSKSVSVSMMLDSQCDIENIKYHYVIYGHRMKSGTMMSDILKYEDEDFFNDNRIISFDTIYQNLDWEIFSTYLKSYEYDNTRIIFFSDSEWLEYIQRLQSQSIHKTNIELSSDDVVLTLYICDYRIAGGRYVVHARLVK